jgi:hypothetical protein
MDGKWRERESKVLEEERMKRRQMTCERREEQAKRLRRSQLYTHAKKSGQVAWFLHKLFVEGCITEPRVKSSVI